MAAFNSEPDMEQLLDSVQDSTPISMENEDYDDEPVERYHKLEKMHKHNVPAKAAEEHGSTEKTKKSILSTLESVDEGTYMDALLVVVCFWIVTLKDTQSLMGRLEQMTSGSIKREYISAMTTGLVFFGMKYMKIV